MQTERLLTKVETLTSFYDISNDKYYLIDHNLSFDQNAGPEDFLCTCTALVTANGNMI